LFVILALSRIAGFSTTNQLNAANGNVTRVAMTANTSGFKVPSPAMTITC
jgi:hypothetical protein